MKKPLYPIIISHQGNGFRIDSNRGNLMDCLGTYSEAFSMAVDIAQCFYKLRSMAHLEISDVLTHTSALPAANEWAGDNGLSQACIIPVDDSIFSLYATEVKNA